MPDLSQQEDCFILFANHGVGLDLTRLNSNVFLALNGPEMERKCVIAQRK
jgi:hypothetical protein